VVIGAGMVAVWLVFSSSRHVSGRRWLAALLMAAVVGGAGLFGAFSRLVQNIVHRHDVAGDTIKERGFGQLEETITAFKAAPLGQGAGTEQLGGTYFRTGEMVFTTYETQLPRVVMESGFLGLAGFLVVCAGALLALQSARREGATSEERSVLLATQLLLLPLFYSNVIFNHIASAFVWMLFAVVLANAKPGQTTTIASSRRNRSRPMPIQASNVASAPAPSVRESIV